MNKEMNAIIERETAGGQRLIRVCCFIVIGLSVLSLSGWMAGMTVLASLNPDYIPMAPSTALSLLLVSMSLLSYLPRSGGRSGSRIGLVMLPPVIIFCLYTVTLFFWDYAVDIETYLVRTPKTFGGVPSGHMSPLTSVLLLLSAAVLIVLHMTPATGRLPRQIAALLASIVVLASVVLVIGYFYGTPLLYGGAVIPVAVTTAVSLLLLGAGLIGAIGSDYFPLRPFVGTSARAMLLRTFLPVSFASIVLLELVEVRTPVFEKIDHAVWSGLTALVAVAVIGAVVSYIARKIGTTIDYAQEALRKESDRLEAASLAGRVALWEWDIRNGGLEWSGVVDEMLGYEPGGLPRTVKSWEQSIHPDDRARVVARLTEHLERNVPYDVEYRIIRRDGASAWWHDVGSARWDDDGRAYKMAGACADITERKHAEDAVKAVNSYNRSLIEASLDPLVTIDASGKVTDVNAATETVTGCSKKELVGTDFSDYFTDPEKAREGYQLVFRKGTVRDYPLEIRNRDGRVTPVLYNASVYRDEAGNVAGVFAAARDITERKQAEEVLRESEEQFRAFFDHSIDAMLITSPDGRVHRANAEACRTFGMTEEEICFSGREGVANPSDPRIRAAIEERARTGRFRGEVTLKRKDGTMFPAAISTSIFRDRFGDEKTSMIIRDITEQKRMQELMVQSERMEAVGNLAAGLAHEINNPLGIIVQAVQSIERRVSEKLPANREAAGELGVGLDQVRAYLDRRQIPEFIRSIHEASDRAVKIIQNMLQFSRRSTEEGKKPVAVELLVDRALELAATDYDLKKRYDFRNIRIVRDYEAGLPSVPVVEVEIEQVVLNILKNAAQAMKDNPPQREPEITLRLRREEKYAVIAVEDNGCGMDENVKSRVFEPFFTTKEPGVGTGLGLSVSYAIVTMNHKGTISVASSPGQGSCFTIRLPLEEGG